MKRTIRARFRTRAAAGLAVVMVAAGAAGGSAEASERLTEAEASGRLTEAEAIERGRPLCVEELEGRGILNLGPGPYFTSVPSLYWHPPTARYYLEYTENTHLCEYRCAVDFDATGGDPNRRLVITPNHEGPRGRQELFECS